jgi:hypothetical protein
VTRDESEAFAHAIHAVVATKATESVFFCRAHVAAAIHTGFGSMDTFRAFLDAGDALVPFVEAYRMPAAHDGFFPAATDTADAKVACVLSSGTIWRMVVPRGANGRPTP